LQLCPDLGQSLLQAVLNSVDPLSDFQPAGVYLLAMLAGVFEELGDFFPAGAGGKLRQRPISPSLVTGTGTSPCVRHGGKFLAVFPHHSRLGR
jgi:hypothetical protein